LLQLICLLSKKTAELYLKQHPEQQKSVAPVFLADIHNLEFDIPTLFVDAVSNFSYYWINFIERDGNEKKLKGFTLLKTYEDFENLFQQLDIKDQLPSKLPHTNNPFQLEKVNHRIEHNQYIINHVLFQISSMLQVDTTLKSNTSKQDVHSSL